MHKAGEWCLSPCTWHSAGGWWRRNDEFRPLFHSLTRGATSPPATVNDSLTAAPGLSPPRPRPLCQGRRGLESLQLLHSLHWLTHTRDPSSAWVTCSVAPSHGNRGAVGDSSPGQGLPWGFLCFRCALGQDAALSIWEGFGEPYSTLQPARDGLLWSNVHYDSSKLWSPCNIKWCKIPLPQQRTLSPCGSLAAWSAELPGLAFG